MEDKKKWHASFKVLKEKNLSIQNSTFSENNLSERRWNKYSKWRKIKINNSQQNYSKRIAKASISIRKKLYQKKTWNITNRGREMVKFLIYKKIDYSPFKLFETYLIVKWKKMFNTDGILNYEDMTIVHRNLLDVWFLHSYWTIKILVLSNQCKVQCVFWNS